ncbi:hypothetical protein C0J45_2047 [Silurus meridionalis]|nr:hypothetical protein C0J45_2047 [Silurus meridionalis]
MGALTHHGSGPALAGADHHSSFWGSQMDLAEGFEMGSALSPTTPAQSSPCSQASEAHLSAVSFPCDESMQLRLSSSEEGGAAENSLPRAAPGCSPGSRHTGGQFRETGTSKRLPGSLGSSARHVSVSPCRSRLYDLPGFDKICPTLLRIDQALVMKQEVSTILRKKAIEVIPPSDREFIFYSRYFVVPKKDEVFHIMVYMFGAVGLSAVNAIVLATELILKAGKGARTIEDLRVIVLPFETVFVFAWLTLQIYNAWRRYKDGALYLYEDTRRTGPEHFVVKGADHAVFAHEGEDVILNCSVDSHVPGSEIEEVTWKKTDGDQDILVLLYQNSEIFPESSHESYRGRVDLFLSEITKGNFSLKLKEVKMEDKGEFTCEVHTSNMSARTTVVSLHYMY